MQHNSTAGVPVDDRPNALSDEDIAEIAERMEATDPSAAFWREFARAVLAANAGVEKWPELPDTRLEQLMQPYGVQGMDVETFCKDTPP